jgi:hypothetical protein
VPLAGTTRNVHLNIQDLLAGVAPKERAAERRGIEKLVLVRFELILNDIIITFQIPLRLIFNFYICYIWLFSEMEQRNEANLRTLLDTPYQQLWWW